MIRESASSVQSVGNREVSYPHYIDRVYGTKAGPFIGLRSGYLLLCCYCYVCILVVRMVCVRDLGEVGILCYREVLC